MSLMAEPSATGRFGEFGGRFVPETLVPACQELEAAFREAWADPVFRAELDDQLRQYAGRPSILTECANLSEQLGIRLLLKREDLNHTGSPQDQQRARPGVAGEADGQDSASSPRRAPASTASPARPRRRCWAWSARCTWAPSTSSARRSTCSA